MTKMARVRRRPAELRDDFAKTPAKLRTNSARNLDHYETEGLVPFPFLLLLLLKRVNNNYDAYPQTP